MVEDRESGDRYEEDEKRGRGVNIADVAVERRDPNG
jgi:hypothetical protein